MGNDGSLRHPMRSRCMFEWRSMRKASKFWTMKASCLKHFKQAVPVWMQARIPCSSVGILMSVSVSFLRDEAPIYFFVLIER